MTKNQVVRKNHEFQKIINLKKQVVSRYLVVYYRNNKTGLKVGISVSKKFANAVMRNRYRRQVRHALDQINKWDIKKDAIIILRKSFFKLSFDKKVEELRKILGRMNNGK